MSTAKKFDRLPEEVLLDLYRHENRATLERLSMKDLGGRDPDRSLQARVKPLDMDHVHLLSRLINDDPTHDFTPIVVFELPDGRRLIADGFHRYECRWRLKCADVLGWKIKGTELEALEYATCCNRIALLGQKPEDKAKAVRMLLENDVWFGRNSTWIARHCGCVTTTVVKVRAAYCAERGLDLPRVVETQGGGRVAIGKRKRGEPFRAWEPHGANGRQRQTRVFGKTVTLPTDFKEAQAQALSLWEEEKKKSRCLRWHVLSVFFARKGIVIDHPPITLDKRAGLSGAVAGNAVVVATELENPRDIACAIGQLIGIQADVNLPSARRVVLCYRERANKTAIEVFVRAGFEFLTPDEFADSLKGSSGA